MDLTYVIAVMLVLAFIGVILAGKAMRKKHSRNQPNEGIEQGRYDELAEEKRAIQAKEEELLVEHPYFELKKLRLHKEKAVSAGDHVKVSELDDQIDAIREKWEGADEEQLERAYHQQLAVMRKRLSQIEIEMREILRKVS